MSIALQNFYAIHGLLTYVALVGSASLQHPMIVVSQSIEKPNDAIITQNETAVIFSQLRAVTKLRCETAFIRRMERS